MHKKILILFFLNCFMVSASYAEEKFNGGISFDFEKQKNPQAEKIQKSLPSLEKDFVDLNYSIEFKPLNIIGVDEMKIKKQLKKNTFYSPNSKYAPDAYEISLSTGKAAGKINEAEKLETLLRRNPNDRELLFAYAIQLKNENKLDSALKIANQAVEIDPEFALGHFLKGDILRTMERFKEAAEEYIYTTQINPYCADAYYNIAKILELLDDKELALDYYKTAYQINPNDIEIRDIILKRYIEL